jgi:uncharacterized membrane protein YuzA (DUF378 family)
MMGCVAPFTRSTYFYHNRRIKMTYETIHIIAQVPMYIGGILAGVNAVYGANFVESNLGHCNYSKAVHALIFASTIYSIANLFYC